MSDLSETDTESYVRDRDSISYYYKLYNIIIIDSITVVLKLGSTEPQGFGEAVAGVRLRSE